MIENKRHKILSFTFFFILFLLQIFHQICNFLLFILQFAISSNTLNTANYII